MERQSNGKLKICDSKQKNDVTKAFILKHFSLEAGGVGLFTCNDQLAFSCPSIKSHRRLCLSPICFIHV